MSGIANIFSTIDSAKRVLGDRLSGGVVADLQKTLGRAKEDAQQFRDTQKAGGRAAEAAMLSMAMNVMPGGMIVQASDVLPFKLFNGLKKTLNTPGVDARHVAENSNVGYMPDDNVLRTVISDLGARLKVDPSQPIKAGATIKDILQHDELFNIPAYKELADIPVRPLSKDKQGSNGNLLPGVNHPIGTIGLKPRDNPEDLISVILHELQHAVDTVIGTQNGGSASNYLVNPRGLKLAAKNAYNLYENNLAGLPISKPINHVIKDFNTLNGVHRQARAAYKKIPGEVRAQITQDMRKTAADDMGTVFKLLRDPKFQMELIPTTEKFDNSPLIQDLIKKYAKP